MTYFLSKISQNLAKFPKIQPAYSALLGWLLISLVGLNACGQPANQRDVSTPISPPESDFSETELSQPESSTPSSAETQSPDRMESRVQRQVKVFFPIARSQDPTNVKSVWRTTSSQGVAQFAIAQLLAGPTSSEKQQGLATVPPLSGESNCGQDFTISINNGEAQLQFCRNIIHDGIADSVRTKTAIEKTLKQFSTVSHVIILNRNGNCLGDESGDNLCLGKGSNPVKLTPLSQIAINGFGPVNIGMTVDQASQAAGFDLIPVSSNPNPVCSYYKPTQLSEGLNANFMVRNGRIARIDIKDSRPTTISGARVGDTENQVKSLYGERLQVNPLPNSEQGHFLTFVPQSQRDQNLRLKFATDGTKVTQIIIGKRPEVDYIEGCLDIVPGGV